ncbi:MAG TPA: HNH endonuclease signature motif containing protein [Anaeromyxobacteraceae bacterium]|nr:HNH endonuclease signature motif containing protein [Anaeromyxobacteraceae bacterium]
MTAKTPSSLDSRTLARRLGELAGDERQIQVDFLLHLDEFDRRRAYLELGYGSLWTFCLEALHLREGPAGRRIAAMKVLRRFPRLAEALRDGRLCLTTLALLGQVLTEENAEELVARAAFRTTAEVDHLVASLKPRPAPREGLRRLPEPVEATAPSPSESSPELRDAEREPSHQRLQGAAPLALEEAPRPHPAEMRAVSQDLWSLRVTIDGACKDDLETLAMMLSHKFPRKDLAAVLHEAIRCGIEKHGKRQGAVKPARKTPEATPTKDPAGIPAELRRQVWERDGGCCAWVGPDDRRCGSRWQLQVDHVDPVGRGGRATIDRLRLLCKSHNLLYAEQVYGREHMRKYRKGRFTDLAGSGGAVPMAREAMAAG